MSSSESGSSSSNFDSFADAEPDLKREPSLAVPSLSIQPPSPSVTRRPMLSIETKTHEESLSARRSKLENLRSMIECEFEKEAPFPLPSSSFSGPITPGETVSMCSWGRKILKENNYANSQELVVHAKDTPQAKVSLDSFPLTPHSTLPRRGSDHAIDLKLKKTSSPAINNVQKSTTNESSSSSSGQSSKTNTLDHYRTPPESGPNSKCQSLERGLRGPRWPPIASASSQSNTLGRDTSGSFNSSTDRYYSFDTETWNEEARELNRLKDSENTEVIEKLLVNADVASDTSSHKTPGVFRDSVDSSPAHKKLDSITERCETSPTPLNTHHKTQVAASEEKKSNSLPAYIRIENGNKQPDIVASHNTLGDTNRHSTESCPPPVAPPRNNKKRNREQNSGHSSAQEDIFVAEMPARRRTSTEKTLRDSTLKREAKGDPLDAVQLKNLDTGESMPLSEADKRLNWYMMGIGKSNSRKASAALNQSLSSRTSDDDRSSVCTSAWGADADSKSNKLSLPMMETRTNTMGRFFRREWGKIKYTMSSATKAGQNIINKNDHTSDEEFDGGEQLVGIVRPKHHKKGPFDFEQLRKVQSLEGHHTNAIYCLKFSFCGRLLASAGSDYTIGLWVLKDSAEHFNRMREKYTMEAKKSAENPLLASSSISETLFQIAQQSLDQDDNEVLAASVDGVVRKSSSTTSSSTDDIWHPFLPKPFGIFKGHTAAILDISWSKNWFLLSGSADKTARLWHISRSECLCVFQHLDFVTACSFWPKDDRYFLSCSLDGKLRLWHIPDKKVALWNEVPEKSQSGALVTAMTFVKNFRFVVVGTYDGRCIFFTTQQLKFYTAIDVYANKNRQHKITGLSVYQDKLLVTTNDSRVRFYDLRDLSLGCKFKGAKITCGQTKASFSPNGRHIICGSDDKYIYIWRTSSTNSDSRLAVTVRKDRNSMWERVRAHTDHVTAAIFAPKPELIFKMIEKAKQRLGMDPSTSIPSTPVQGPSRQSTVAAFAKATTMPAAAATTAAAQTPARKKDVLATFDSRNLSGDIIVSADFSGNILVFINRVRARTGSSSFFTTD